eukprot:1158928-Pelagomonas_calceolata.AAC.2
MPAKKAACLALGQSALIVCLGIRKGVLDFLQEGGCLIEVKGKSVNSCCVHAWRSSAPSSWQRSCSSHSLLRSTSPGSC